MPPNRLFDFCVWDIRLHLHQRSQGRNSESDVNFACGAARSTLPELTDRFELAATVACKQSGTHVAIKRGAGPIAQPRDQPILERIDGAIFDMARVIDFIAGQMLPESPLPDATFAARLANGTESLLPWQRLRKTALDQAPAG
jgi:hypothetical protein